MNSIGSSVWPYWGLPPDEEMIRGQVEYAEEKTKELRGRRPESKLPLFGAIAGIIIGIIIGGRTGNVFWLVGYVVAGGIIGTFLGSGIGALIAKWRRTNRIDRNHFAE